MTAQGDPTPSDLDWYLHRDFSSILDSEAFEAYGLTGAGPDRQYSVCISRSRGGFSLVARTKVKRWEALKESHRVLAESDWRELQRALENARFWSSPGANGSWLGSEIWAIEGRRGDAYSWSTYPEPRPGPQRNLGTLFLSLASLEPPWLARAAMRSAKDWTPCRELHYYLAVPHNPFAELHPYFRFASVGSPVTESRAEEAYGFLCDTHDHDRYRVCIARRGDTISLIGAWEQGTSKVSMEGRRDLRWSDWDRLQQSLASADFWNLSGEDAAPNFRGNVWIVEGRFGNSFHAVRRRAPRTGSFRALGKLFTEFFGVAIPRVRRKRDNRSGVVIPSTDQSEI